MIKYNKKHLIFILAAFLFTNSIVKAQDTVYVDGQMYIKKIQKPKINKTKFNELFTQGNMMMLENFDDTALGTFLTIHEVDPLNANLNFKIGQLYLRSPSQKLSSIEFLEVAVKKVTPNYSPDDANEKKCPALVYYCLGQAYHLAYRFDEAILMFQKFKGFVNTGDVAMANDIKRRIEMSLTAKELTQSPVKCTITNLGDSINTEKPEYGAVITADESQLFFTSRRYNAETGGNDNRTIDDKYYEDIWTCDRKEDGTWGEARPLSTHINSWYNEAVVGISADGQQLFLYKDEGGGSIFYSKLEGNQWSYAYKLGTDPGDITDINSPSWEPSACLSPDGNTLFFVSNRLGGFGGRDIYKCVKLPTGRWSKATNLGPTINTKYDEDAPFMHPDGITMFFSSVGHNTMGGFDIFFSMLSDTGWSKPQNMGYPINTTDDDIFYVMSSDGKRSYFSSVRAEGHGEKDLYMVTTPKTVVAPIVLVKGYITFLGKKEMPSFVTITATDNETGNITQEVHPNSKSRKYILPLNPGRSGKTYTLLYEAQGYRSHSETISVSPDGEYQEMDKNYDFKTAGSITVSGKAVTRSGDPLSGANIYARDASKKIIGATKAKADGTYAFDLPEVKGESYSLTYEADGYLPMEESITIPTNSSDYEFQKDVHFETPKMLGTISFSGMLTDTKNHVIKNAQILVVDNKTKAVVGTYNPTALGEYYFNLERGLNYNISYEAEGYLFHSENVNLPVDKKYSEIKKNIQLEKTSKGSKVVLNNIFFDSGKSILQEKSNTELEALLKFLKEKKNLKIEIGGYTDNQGDETANLDLSKKRAEAVMSWLIERGIEANKLDAQGYGSAYPIAPNQVNGKPDLANMQSNRRVEFKIIE